MEWIDDKFLHRPYKLWDGCFEWESSKIQSMVNDMKRCKDNRELTQTEKDLLDKWVSMGDENIVIWVTQFRGSWMFQFKIQNKQTEEIIGHVRLQYKCDEKYAAWWEPKKKKMTQAHVDRVKRELFKTIIFEGYKYPSDIDYMCAGCFVRDMPREFEMVSTLNTFITYTEIPEENFEGSFYDSQNSCVSCKDTLCLYKRIN